MALEPEDLGQLIRQRRLEQKLTLAELAERASVSTSYVSQVERGTANPTLSSLKGLAEALDFTVGSLLETSPNGDSHCRDDEVAVMRANQRRRIVYPGSEIANELLSPNLQKKMEIILLEAPPGQDSGGHPHQHVGEECGIVIEGEMHFTVGEREWVLGPRDSIYFNSELPHQWRSVGTTDLVAIWIITPPTF